MATRAHNKIQNALLMAFTASGVISKGRRVKFSGADDVIAQCGAGEDGIGYALDDIADGARGTICLEGQAIVPVKVGTGGATRGLFAKTVADGVADQAIADGTTPRYLTGKFMQTGVVGDFVGLMIGVSTPYSTT